MDRVPFHDQLETSDLDLIVAGSKGSVLMIEGFAGTTEELMFQAIAESHRYIQEICDLQIELVQKVQPVKAPVVVVDHSGLIHAIKDRCFGTALKDALRTPGKQERADAVATREQVGAEVNPNPAAEKRTLARGLGGSLARR